jgi:hypothetical protein
LIPYCFLPDRPDSHWSYELLVRLDFLQAALENAPQCVIQLYALLTDAKEDRTLAILTLIFSFLDFLRVTTTVLWNIAKGTNILLTNVQCKTPEEQELFMIRHGRLERKDR